MGHVVPSLSDRWGGPVAVVNGLVPLLSSRVRVRVFAPVGNRSGHIDVHPDHAEVWSVESGLISWLWTGHGMQVARRAAEFVAGCDVIHIHELWHYPHYAIARAARQRKVPVIITPHGALEPWVLRFKGTRKKLYSIFFQRRALREAMFVQALTPHEADVIARFGVPRERIRIIPNGLPQVTVLSLAKQAQSGANGTQIASGYGIFLGRIHPQKGLDMLVRALPLVLSRHPGMKIVVAGPDEGGYQSEIERLARSLGVRDRLAFTGLVKGEQKWKLLTGAKFFVLPSYSEGFSMALLEALAAGVPVVATKVCDVGTLETSEAAILVDPTPHALASGLDSILSRPELAHRLSENGRRLVLERYTWEKVAADILRLYDQAVEIQKTVASK